MSEPIERWDSERVAMAGFGSNVLVTRLETQLNWERQILRYLGAAVAGEWNALPTDVKRNASKLDSVRNGTDFANELPARITRFLHERKDDSRD